MNSKMLYGLLLAAWLVLLALFLFSPFRSPGQTLIVHTNLFLLIIGLMSGAALTGLLMSPLFHRPDSHSGLPRPSLIIFVLSC